MLLWCRLPRAGWGDPVDLLWSLLGALMGRDYAQRRRLRNHVRGEAADAATAALMTVEDVVVDDYAAAAGRSRVSVDRGDLEGSIVELQRWASSARPRLRQARADLMRADSSAVELRQPGSAVMLLGEMLAAVDKYLSATEAFAEGDLDSGFAAILAGHAAWRSMQERNGLASYS